MTPTPALSRQGQTSTALMIKAGRGVVDFLLFVLVLCFTGVAMIAVAIVAPLAVGVSAIIGHHGRNRSSWKPAKAAKAS